MSSHSTKIIVPESKKHPEGVVTQRFREVLKSRFNNNLKELERACEKVAGEEAPSYGALRKHQSGSMPGLDQAAIIACAAGVSLEWLAGVEKPPPHGGAGAGETTELTDPLKRDPSVKPGDLPRGKLHPGYAFGTPGHYQLIVDFYVVGSDERVVLPFGPRETPDADE